MSRGGPLLDELRLDSMMVKQVWTQFGKVEVDLFATCRITHLALPNATG